MLKRCEYIDTCQFCRKIQDRDSSLWKILLRSYCLGGISARCFRAAHFRRAGEWPADSCSPVGELPESFFRLR